MKPIWAIAALSLLWGCERSYSFSGLKEGTAKSRIIATWGQPAIIARKLETQLGNVLEIYQYESKTMGQKEPDRYTLYFKDGKLLYWNSANWRGSSLSERVPGKKR